VVAWLSRYAVRENLRIEREILANIWKFFSDEFLQECIFVLVETIIKMTSPPRTIRSRALHGSIRDVSGALVAQALAGNTRSILEADKENQNTASLIRDKLVLEYSIRASRLKTDIASLRTKFGERGYEKAVVDKFKSAVLDMSVATDAACNSAKALQGKDLSIFKVYCFFVGLEHLGEALRETLNTTEDVEVPQFHEVYREYLSKGLSFSLDSESMEELADNFAHTCVRSARPRVVAETPSISPTKRSLSPQRRPPASQSPDKSITSLRGQLLREAMEAMKEAAGSSQNSPPLKKSPPKSVSPKKLSKEDRDQKLADFANLVAYIHEPFDPSTEIAIKKAKELHAILKAEIHAVEEQISAGEFFTQI